MEGRPRCRNSRASQITGSAAASVPSRNCSAPELMPETMAWVRVSTFIREPLLSFLVDVLSSGLHNRNDWPCLAILRPDHRDGGAEISQVAAQAAARFAARLFLAQAFSKLNSAIARGRFRKGHHFARCWP